MRILLIEDDLVAARGIMLMLKSGGAVVDHADTGEEGLELSRHYDYDIVILDLILPDIEGFEVVRRMRIARNDTPVLILSGLSRPQVKVKGLGLGADDFITKPFDKAELMARMQAIIRRSKGFSQPSLRVGPLLLNLDQRAWRARASNRQGVLDPGTAGAAQRHGADQGGIPQSSLWRHG
jgi:two-component system, cell cycle response regulator CtrA